MGCDVKNDWCKIRKKYLILTPTYHLDTSNLYGWAMIEYLLYGRFKWLENFNGFDAMSTGKKSRTRFIHEIDLEYPDELYALHNDYPLAPEKLAISYDMLPDYFKEIAGKYETKVGDVMKLIPNLGKKTNYAIHYRDLQLYLP